MIEIKNLSKQFQNETEIDYCDMIFENGKSYMLLGASGCGKSTLLNMIAGILSPSKGSIVIDGVEISTHLNPAPDHAEAQGRQFSKEEFAKFQNDQDAVDYTGKLFTKEHEGHDRRSISEYKCYHYTFDIVLGVSKPEYSEEELQKIIEDNNKGFELDGQHYTNYEGTQLQRKLETEIRKQKDIQIMAKASGNKELVQESQTKITQLTRKYKQLSDVSGLPTKMERMRVSGYKRTSVAKMK